MAKKKPKSKFQRRPRGMRAEYFPLVDVYFCRDLDGNCSVWDASVVDGKPRSKPLKSAQHRGCWNAFSEWEKYYNGNNAKCLAHSTEESYYMFGKCFFNVAPGRMRKLRLRQIAVNPYKEELEQWAEEEERKYVEKILKRKGELPEEQE